MFSRDSQSPRNSKATQAHPRLHNDLEDTSNKRRSHYSSDQEQSTENQAEAKSPASGLSASSIPANNGSGSSTALERSQSWQVAPNLFTSFRYAWAGIAYAFTTQRNFRVHTVIGSIAITLCWLLHVSNVEIAVICLTIGAVLVMEILNTALESLVDLTVGQTYHELAKVAKDCAAGAVLMAAIVALSIAILIFAPPLWDNLHNYIV